MKQVTLVCYASPYNVPTRKSPCESALEILLKYCTILNACKKYQSDTYKISNALYSI